MAGSSLTSYSKEAGLVNIVKSSVQSLSHMEREGKYPMILNTECPPDGDDPRGDCLLAKVNGHSAQLYTTFRPGQIDMNRTTYDDLVKGLRRLPKGLRSETVYISGGAGFTLIFGAIAPREEQDDPSTHVGDNLTRGVTLTYDGTTLFANTAEWDNFLADYVHTNGTSV
jgi:hypothetical protein